MGKRQGETPLPEIVRERGSPGHLLPGPSFILRSSSGCFELGFEPDLILVATSNKGIDRDRIPIPLPHLPDGILVANNGHVGESLISVGVVEMRVCLDYVGEIPA